MLKVGIVEIKEGMKLKDTYWLDGVADCSNEDLMRRDWRPVQDESTYKVFKKMVDKNGKSFWYNAVGRNYMIVIETNNSIYMIHNPKILNSKNEQIKLSDIPYIKSQSAYGIKCAKDTVGCTRRRGKNCLDCMSISKVERVILELYDDETTREYTVSFGEGSWGEGFHEVIITK